MASAAVSWTAGIACALAGVGTCVLFWPDPDPEPAIPPAERAAVHPAENSPEAAKSGLDVKAQSVSQLDIEIPAGRSAQPTEQAVSPNSVAPDDGRSRLRLACEGSIRWHESVDRSLFRVVWRKPGVSTQERSMHLREDGRFRMFRVADVTEIDVLIYLQGDKYPLETFLGVGLSATGTAFPPRLQAVDVTAVRKYELSLVDQDGRSVDEFRSVQTYDAGMGPLMRFADDSDGGRVEIVRRFPEQPAKAWARGFTPVSFALGDEPRPVRMVRAPTLTVILQFDPFGIRPVPRIRIAPVEGDWWQSLQFRDAWAMRQKREPENPDVTTVTLPVADDAPTITHLRSSGYRRGSFDEPQSVYAITKPGRYRVTWSLRGEFAKSKPLVVEIEPGSHKVVTLPVDERDYQHIQAGLRKR